MNKIKDPRLKLQGLAKEQLVTEVQTRGGRGPERKNQLLLSGVGG